MIHNPGAAQSVPRYWPSGKRHFRISRANLPMRHSLASSSSRLSSVSSQCGFFMLICVTPFRLMSRNGSVTTRRTKKNFLQEPDCCRHDGWIVKRLLQVFTGWKLGNKRTAEHNFPSLSGCRSTPICSRHATRYTLRLFPTGQV